jgi:hypothetical protein
MKGTFTAVVSTPQTIYTNTNNTLSVYQFYVDCTNIQSGDNLKVIISTDTTASLRQTITDNITTASLGDDKVALVFPLLLGIGDTYSIVLEQTTGVARTFDWSVNVVEYE